MFVPTVRDVHQRQSEAEACLADGGRGEDRRSPAHFLLVLSIEVWMLFVNSGASGLHHCDRARNTVLTGGKEAPPPQQVTHLSEWKKPH